MLPHFAPPPRIATAFLCFFSCACYEPALGGEPVDSDAKKSAFLRDLAADIESAEAQQQRYAATLTETEARVRASMLRMQSLQASLNTEDFPADGNQQGVAITADLVCDPDIGVVMGIKQRGYDRGWRTWLAWAGEVHDTLANDPVTNPYRWYDRYDFYHGMELFREFSATLYAKRRQFITETCAQIRPHFIEPLQNLARKLDDYNAQQAAVKAEVEAALRISDEARRRDTLAQLRPRAEAIKREGDAAKAQMDTLGQALRGAMEQRSVDMLSEMNQLLARLDNLDVPPRGEITRIRPDRIRFRNRAHFDVVLSGRLIPRGLQANDFTLPAGLRLLEHRGGGERLLLRLEKTDALVAGRHAIGIAGDAVPFQWEDAEETDSETLEPLVSRSPQLPTGAGQVPEDGKGTFLTAAALADYPQQQRGFWRTKPGSGEESDPPYHFDQFRDEQGREWFILKGLHRKPDVYSDLEPHQHVTVAEMTKGVVGQYDRRREDCYAGLRSTIERPRPDGTPVCPDDRWWEPAALCFSPDNLIANEAVDALQHDRESCEITDTPGPFAIEYERFVGLSFALLQAGKYIHTLTVTAPSAFQVSVALEWDYTVVEPGRLRFTINKLGDSRVLKEIDAADWTNVGEAYVFTTDTPAKYQFTMEVFNLFDELIHKDVAVAYLDR